MLKLSVFWKKICLLHEVRKSRHSC